MKISRSTAHKFVPFLTFALAAAATGLLATFALGSQSPKPVESAPALKLVPPPPPASKRRLKPRPYLIVKRWMDISVSLGLIVLLAPLMGVIALGIALDGKGSPIVKQARVGSRVRGKGGRFSWETKSITLYKFRTNQAEAATNNVESAKIRYLFSRNSPLSPMDAFLHRTRFDHLPMLFNVLKGDISLVGPRPAEPEEVETYTDKQLRRLEMPAGMTGWWQITKPITKPSSVTLEHMIERDIWYVDNKTLRRDGKILLLTPLVILLGRLYYEFTHAREAE